MYKLIRIKDNHLVNTFQDEQKANLALFFYDSEETPHKVMEDNGGIQSQSSEHFTIVFEHIGEGYDGEYNPDDPEDSPLLRCDIFRNDYLDESIRNGSFCTHIKDETDVSVLLDTMLSHAEELYREHRDENIGTISRILALYSWYDNTKDFRIKAS